jgi:hypothetical protein
MARAATPVPHPRSKDGTGRVDVHGVEVFCEHSQEAGILTACFEPRSDDLEQLVVNR